MFFPLISALYQQSDNSLIVTCFNGGAVNSCQLNWLTNTKNRGMVNLNGT